MTSRREGCVLHRDGGLLSSNLYMGLIQSESRVEQIKIAHVGKNFVKDTYYKEIIMSLVE